KHYKCQSLEELLTICSQPVKPEENANKTLVFSLNNRFSSLENHPLIGRFPARCLLKIDSQPKRFRDYAFDKQKGRDSALRATAQRFGKSIIPQTATKKARSVGGSSKGEICARSKGETLQRIISQDFRPGILGWARRLGHGPELAERMVAEGDGCSLGWSNGPTAAQEVA